MDHGNPLHLVGAAVVAAHVVEFLKRSGRIPWINQNTDRLNRWLAYMMAALNTAGFRLVLTGDLASGAGIHLSLPPADHLVDLLLDFSGAFGSQEFYYRTAIKSGNGKRIGTGTMELAKNVMERLQERLKALASKEPPAG